jgi:hypothetical protein
MHNTYRFCKYYKHICKNNQCDIIPCRRYDGLVYLFYWRDGGLQMSKHESLGNALSNAFKLHEFENLHLESLDVDGEKYSRDELLQLLEL